MVSLLDTSTLLWTLAMPERLSKRAAEAIAGGALLSVASYWEVVIKTRKGLLRIGDRLRNQNAVEWIAVQVREVRQGRNVIRPDRQHAAAHGDDRARPPTHRVANPQ